MAGTCQAKTRPKQSESIMAAKVPTLLLELNRKHSQYEVCETPMEPYAPSGQEERDLKHKSRYFTMGGFSCFFVDAQAEPTCGAEGIVSGCRQISMIHTTIDNHPEACEVVALVIPRRNSRRGC